MILTSVFILMTIIFIWMMMRVYNLYQDIQEQYIEMKKIMDKIDKRIKHIFNSTDARE